MNSNDLENKKKVHAEKLEKVTTEEFQRFLEEPMTKLALAMLPQSSPPELTVTALQAAFRAGINAGMGVAAGDVMDLITKTLLKDRKP